VKAMWEMLLKSAGRLQIHSAIFTSDEDYAPAVGSQRILFPGTAAAVVNKVLPGLMPGR